MSTSRHKPDYSWLAFIALVIILLVVMQECERQKITIFDSPIPGTYKVYVPIIWNNSDAYHWRVDFNNPTELYDFGYELGYVRNGEPQAYTTTQVSVANGQLIIAAHDLQSGSIFTNRAFTQGTFQARILFPETPSCWGAFWLLGDDSCCGQQQCTCAWSQDSTGGLWAATGELDIAENWWGWYAPAAHWGQWPNNQAIQGAGQWVSGWHTYKLVWLSDSVTFYIDDTQTLTFSHTYTNPMKIILNLAGNCEGQMRVDWVEWNQ